MLYTFVGSSDESDVFSSGERATSVEIGVLGVGRTVLVISPCRVTGCEGVGACSGTWAG